MKYYKMALRTGLLIVMGLFTALSAHALVPDHLWIKGPPPVSLTPAAAEFVGLETQANPASLRSDKPFWIEHLEIPLSAVQADRARQLDPRIYESLVFLKNGTPHVRWVLNPEDTQYAAELEKKLSEKGIIYSRGRYFVGYLTASRSCIVQDPKTAVIFSIKSSTNEAAGFYKDKKETVKAAKTARLVNDYIAENFRESENSALRFVPEPLAFYFEAADQAITVKQYDHFNDPNSNIRLVPRTAVLHEYTGKVLAEANGVNDPHRFLSEPVAQALGTAYAERFVNFGLSGDSDHPQNDLIATDPNYRFTGIIYSRDMSDVNLERNIVEARGGHSLIEHFEKMGRSRPGNNLTANEIKIAISMHHGAQRGSGPSWLKPTNDWQNNFHAFLKSRLESVFKNNIKLQGTLLTKSQHSSYDVYFNGPLFLNHLERLRQQRPSCLKVVSPQ